VLRGRFRAHTRLLCSQSVSSQQPDDPPDSLGEGTEGSSRTPSYNLTATMKSLFAARIRRCSRHHSPHSTPASPPDDSTTNKSRLGKANKIFNFDFFKYQDCVKQLICVKCQSVTSDPNLMNK
jgi:hypothetical protein